MKWNLAIVVVMGMGIGVVRADEGPMPVRLRAELLTVTPATGPLMHVQVGNTGATAFEGELAVDFPAGWKVNKSRQAIKVPAGKTIRAAFAIEKGINNAENRYPLALAVSSGGKTWKVEQVTQVASAPFLDIKIDGKHDDWKDAIPLTFVTGGKKTVIRTGYTRRNFFVLVGVEEEAHRPFAEKNAGVRLDRARPADAVQIAISPRDGVMPRGAGDPAGRAEVLYCGDGAMRHYRMNWFEGKVQNEPIEAEKHELSALCNGRVTRVEGWTWYEIAIPVKGLGEIEPEPGREFGFSVLVHDPDGTGLRDLGEAIGLWAGQRSAFAWTRWMGSCIKEEGAMNSMIEWGFCSSAQ